MIENNRNNNLEKDFKNNKQKNEFSIYSKLELERRKIENLYEKEYEKENIKTQNSISLDFFPDKYRKQISETIFITEDKKKNQNLKITIDNNKFNRRNLFASSSKNFITNYKDKIKKII